MFEEIDGLKGFIDDYRPLYPLLMASLAARFREEWTFNSIAMAGSTLSYQETAYILREGLTVKGHTLNEHLEAMNHKEAIDYLDAALNTQRVSEQLIKEIHSILFSGLRYPKNSQEIVNQPGVYRSDDNQGDGDYSKQAIFYPATQISDGMGRLVEWYNQNESSVHPIELASRLYHKLLAIHPFADGNGRTARLLMNFVLMQKEYPPAILQHEIRQDYLEALKWADQGKVQPLIELVAEEVKRTLEIMITEIQKSFAHEG